jgi:hypothetical protein
VLVAGLALAAPGIWMIAVDGKGTCTLTPPAERCPMRYATLGGGIGLTAAGGALVIAGAVMALLPRRPREQAVAVAPLVAPGVAGLAAAGRW